MFISVVRRRSVATQSFEVFLLVVSISLLLSLIQHDKSFVLPGVRTFG
jgi:hypothetical protein